jgi:hypothetical protein
MKSKAYAAFETVGSMEIATEKGDKFEKDNMTSMEVEVPGSAETSPARQPRISSIS